jgi:phosphoglycolate phosphatase
MTIVWDFNGTLLDDMQVCINCMNMMLKDRDLPALDMERYRKVFTFPVRDYYLSLGFDFSKEPFEVPAHQFIDLYRENMHSAPLQPEAVSMLNYFRQKHLPQYILSAMEQDFLVETLESKGITSYFEKICGITNHLGDGKTEMAREMIGMIGGNRRDIWLIGDTEHDFEVARATGISCVLIAQGHQSYERLSLLECTVVKEMKDLPALFP